MKATKTTIYKLGRHEIECILLKHFGCDPKNVRVDFQFEYPEPEQPIVSSCTLEVQEGEVRV